ncbi:hypothetical protein [Paraburkholderia tropica]|uniref:hypothetical protein n=1 Tax=Paraburkholderia tropica TaxID=92647 RepID=UPI003D29E0BC
MGDATNGYSIVDKDGAVTSRNLDLGTAQAMVNFYLENDVAFGCTLRIVPSEPIQPAPPTVFDLRPHHVANPPPMLPDVEAGEERKYLRECIIRREDVGKAREAAKEAVQRCQAQLHMCGIEVERLRADDEAETAAAAVALATRLKDGAAAPLEPNLGTFRKAMIEAEARYDAAKRAASLLSADLDAEERKFTESETAVRLAADVVVRAEFQQRVEQLNALWAQITPIRQLIDDALNSGTPIDAVPARKAYAVPELKFAGDSSNKCRLHRYRQALQHDADTTFADQSAEVKQ